MGTGDVRTRTVRMGAPTVPWSVRAISHMSFISVFYANHGHREFASLPRETGGRTELMR
jgi:hypothetical protein